MPTEKTNGTLVRASEFIAPAQEHVHLTGAKSTATAILASSLRRNAEEDRLVVIVAPTHEEALLAQDDISFVDQGARAAYLPCTDVSPYDGGRPDRNVTLNRAATLSLLDSGRLNYLITTASGWIRLCMPPEILSEGALCFTPGTRVDLRLVAEQLTAGGYQRVPVVEDPGTFAVRGDILDLWPPGAESPFRLELEFESLKRTRVYNPDTQVSLPGDEAIHPSGSIFVSPAREAIVTPSSQQRAKEQMQALCDRASFPSKKARALIEDVSEGHLFIGAGAYLPAYADLEPLVSRLPGGTVVLFENPLKITELVSAELDSVDAAYEALDDQPHFAPEAHYLLGEALNQSVENLSLVLLHSTNIVGGSERGFESLRSAPLECGNLSTLPQDELIQRLTHLRKSGGREASLAPVADEIRRWLEEGLCVVISARVETQADRLAALLEHRDLQPRRLRPDLANPPGGALFITTGRLARGIVAPLEGLVLLTEEEIFGKRAHRTQKKAKAALVGALDDLRSLTPGDFIVHVEHGIGRYNGLLHRTVGEHLVELLVVEYYGGDKLLLPVYRLNQIQKFSGEGAPKLDRLGGQTFSKTKSQVRKKVRIMADQLLKLYAERGAVRRPPLDAPGDEYAAFEAAFPYEETPDQAAAIEDVLNDLRKETVMDRLVCGDVGFGKTEVALRAAFLAAHAGRQVALLCPTTVLAEQHLRTFVDRLSSTGIEVRGLSRFQNKKAQGITTAGLKAGSVDVVIGTHRLLSKDVHFSKLGLLIIDEEQRFGVAHKERLKELRKTVDVLTLSATPIPRTLNLAVGGLRDMSVIATAPQERRSIRTITSWFDERVIAQAVTREIERGGQVYYVHNRIAEIEERAALLKRLVPHARIAVGHGQMSEKALEKTMLDFVAGEYDILCATAIVESGLDIPHANTILIDRADLFGLSQLYQIRGRVGRSSERAYCYLLVPPEERLSSEARARIATLERYSELGSGFHVATMDMELRGAGELLGADQSGFSTKVGFELFSQMLEEATCELRGETYISEVDPELSIDVEALLPEAYIEDIGVRLSLYKKYALASDEEDIARIDGEMSDRFGAPPPEAVRFSEVMRLKTHLRRLRALGLSASSQTATLHLRQDTPLMGARLVPFVAGSKGKYKLTPDGRLTRRAAKDQKEESGLTHADRMLVELSSLLS